MFTRDAISLVLFHQNCIFHQGLTATVNSVWLYSDFIGNQEIAIKDHNVWWRNTHFRVVKDGRASCFNQFMFQIRSWKFSEGYFKIVYVLLNYLSTYMSFFHRCHIKKPMNNDKIISLRRLFWLLITYRTLDQNRWLFILHVIFNMKSSMASFDFCGLRIRIHCNN